MRNNFPAVAGSAPRFSKRAQRLRKLWSAARLGATDGGSIGTPQTRSISAKRLSTCSGGQARVGLIAKAP